MMLSTLAAVFTARGILAFPAERSTELKTLVIVRNKKLMPTIFIYMSARGITSPSAPSHMGSFADTAYTPAASTAPNKVENTIDSLAAFLASSILPSPIFLATMNIKLTLTAVIKPSMSHTVEALIPILAVAAAPRVPTIAVSMRLARDTRSCSSMEGTAILSTVCMGVFPESRISDILSPLSFLFFVYNRSDDNKIKCPCLHKYSFSPKHIKTDGIYTYRPSFLR